MAERTVIINRAPVLTLWGAVVAERLGFDSDTALTLGKGLAGLTAQSKGRTLGIFKPPRQEPGSSPKKVGLGEELWIELCGRGIPAKRTRDGVRAVVKDQPIEPASVQRYVEQKFGTDLAAVRAAMTELAEAFSPEELAEQGFALYTRFRPTIPAGEAGWGAKGKLDLGLLRRLARRAAG
jgi:hypothetical protein